MKHVNMKWLFKTVICGFTACLLSLNMMAGEPRQTKAGADFELKQVDKNKVLIACNMVAKGAEYYEIERSYNNKDFTTVCLVFPATAGEIMRNGIAMKDKVSEAGKTIYYRLKKVDGETVEYSGSKNIQLQ